MQARSLARLGLFVIEQFFPNEFCARLCAEVRSSAGMPSHVEREGRYVIDESIRKATGHPVSDAASAEVASRLAALRGDLEKHFNVRLAYQERAYFAKYAPGSYFHPHADAGAAPDTPAEIKARKVVVVVFLNGESDVRTPDTYRGGALTFYGLFDDPRWRPMGLPLRGETGLLVAFGAHVIHEVSPVTHGERYTIVTRFR